VGNTMLIDINIAKQSPEIARGVDTGGAGDQGIMVGYATAETDSYLPLEYELARSLNKQIFDKFPYDGKTQVTVDGEKVTTVIASFQNAPAKELQKIVDMWLSNNGVNYPTVSHLNPTGDWNQGGFDSDVGLTGRKIAVDNYGPHIPVGGGSFSGKDPSKVDRSAAYMARRIAVDLLKAKSAKEVFVYLAYSIGVAEPVQAEARIDGKVEPITGYDLTPLGISEFLDLKKPKYLQTAVWGHYGRGFDWS
jgi:S-adenosylmethionine synthetase